MSESTPGAMPGSTSPPLEHPGNGTSPESASLPAAEYASTPHGATEPPRPTARFVAGLVALGIALVVVAAGAAAGGAALWPKTYTARAQVLYVIQQQQPTGFLRDDLALTTQVVLLESPAVLGPVAQRERTPLDKLTQQVTADVVSGSEILTIQAHADSPAAAMRLASEVIDQYLAISRHNPAPSPARVYLENQLADVHHQIDALTGQLDSGAQLTSASDRAGSIQNQLDQLTLVEMGQPSPQLVVIPYLDPTAVTPRASIAAAAGALAGLLVALVVIGMLVRRRSLR